MKAFLALLLGVCVSSVLTQGIPSYRPIQRRQLTPNQQGQILSDIQQHHRFAPPQATNQFNQPGFNRQFNGRQPPFVQQSQGVIFPPQTTVQSSVRFQQLPSQQSAPVFRPIPNGRQQPQQTLLTQSPTAQRQIQFQRSVQSQIGQPGQLTPPQTNFNPFQQNIPFTEQFGNFQNRPVAAPLTQQPSQQFPQLNNNNNLVRFPVQNQQQFIQKPSQNPFVQPSETFPPQNVAPLSGNFQPSSNQFLQPTQALPLQQRQNVFRDTRTEEERVRDMKERQKLIEKHEKFAQKQYEKQQFKVQQLHADFVKKQQQIQEETQNQLKQIPNDNHRRTTTRSRGLHPGEENLFQKSVQNYYEVNPTPSIATTTQAAPTSVSATTFNPSQVSVIPLKKNKNKSEVKTLNAEDIQLLLQGNRQKLFQQLKQDTEKSIKPSKKVNKSLGLGREELFQQLKLALAEQPQDLGDKNFTTMDLVLPNGEKVQVIRTTDPDLIKNANVAQENILEQIVPTTTAAPISVEDLAKSGILPEGADFEVIRQTEDGNLQEVVKIPAQKKVTFVYLEEQDDGTYKIQGVKSNKDKQAKTEGAEVDSILNRIKNGEIQLPPPSIRVTRKQNANQANSLEVPAPSPNTLFTIPSLQNSAEETVPTNPTFTSTVNQSVRTTASPATFPSRGSKSHFVSTTPRYDDNGRSPYSTLPTFSPRPRISSTPVPAPSSSPYVSEEPKYRFVSTIGVSASTPSPVFDRSPSFAAISSTPFPTEAPTTISQSAAQAAQDLTLIMRNNGLFAMSKYLKQSGLDTILNETGPYTIFVPTDKAFKSFLVQLGGPEKADEKFKNNPRLLSGLLLHHVIPGSFQISDLQDEMTGVSLAGTQLRVNQYDMQDIEWNDVKVTTINGASVVQDKQDIEIPQGIAHAVDRVMFPLPVGDILQTMQSDRERRFTHFLRALFASGLSETLQNKSGIKTYTIFAPTDAAFAHLSTEELSALVGEKESAVELVSKHILPTTLYTTGMRFYQVKETIDEKTVTIQKNGGKVKVNEATILTSNIPATNGVIHAIDSLL
jgi:uncharacterized surface protein with fasciclin (FAS1) repeats